jgi:hypothetical protein
MRSGIVSRKVRVFGLGFEKRDNAFFGKGRAGGVLIVSNTSFLGVVGFFGPVFFFSLPPFFWWPGVFFFSFFASSWLGGFRNNLFLQDVPFGEIIIITHCKRRVFLSMEREKVALVLGLLAAFLFFLPSPWTGASFFFFFFCFLLFL